MKLQVQWALHLWKPIHGEGKLVLVLKGNRTRSHKGKRVMGFALYFKSSCVVPSLLLLSPSLWGPAGGCLWWPVSPKLEVQNAVKGIQGGSFPQLKSLCLVVLLPELELFTHSTAPWPYSKGETMFQAVDYSRVAWRLYSDSTRSRSKGQAIQPHSAQLATSGLQKCPPLPSRNQQSALVQWHS